MIYHAVASHPDWWFTWRRHTTHLTALGVQVVQVFRQMQLAALQATEPFEQQLSQCLVD